MTMLENPVTLDTVRRKYRTSKREREDSGNCSCSSCMSNFEDYATDGDYTFILEVEENGTGHNVDAGCRDMSISDYRQHVAAMYPGTAKAKATLRILDRFEKRLARHLAKQLPGLTIKAKAKA